MHGRGAVSIPNRVVAVLRGLEGSGRLVRDKLKRERFSGLSLAFCFPCVEGFCPEAQRSPYA